jgi:hypothetical protein
MPDPREQLTIVVTPDFVSVAGVRFGTRPSVEDLKRILPAGEVREYRQGPEYLPALIFDALGLVARYREDSGQVALIDVFFATSCRDDRPRDAFAGTVILNGQELKRPMRFRDLRRDGEFHFDSNPVPAASGRRVGVSIVPKFECVGIVNFGWNDD